MMPSSARCKGYNGLLAIPMEAPPNTKNELHSPTKGVQNGVPEPIYPGDPGFPAVIEEVKQVRAMVELGIWPTETLKQGNPSGLSGEVPFLLRNTSIYNDGAGDPKAAATYVAMDNPPDLGLLVFRELVRLGVPFKKKYNHFPFHEEITGFQERLIVRIRKAHALGWQVKCYYGLERPETVLELPGCVFCCNDEGAPNHFSFVANHATGYGATYQEILDTFNFQGLLDRQMQVLDVLWQGAMYRMLLGVHYRQDNEEGFKLGQTV